MDLGALRNLGIVAHIDAGKTTVTERVLYYTGVEHRMGEVHEGTAVMDWMPEERERGITITAAVTRCPWRGHVIQLIDTPGHVDFSAEVARSLRVLDGAVVVLCAVAGVQAQTETVLRQAERFALPWLAFVNKMDRPGADFAAAVAALRSRLQAPAVPVQLPLGSGPEFAGVLDLVEPALIRWTDPEGREFRREPVPEEHGEAVAEARRRLQEAVAETDEALLEAYLARDGLTPEELRAGLRQATAARRLVPVLCGAALRNLGIQPLLDAVVDWLPSPLERPPVRGWLPADPAQEVLRHPREDEPFCGLVFKLQHDAHGVQAFCRVYSGRVREGDQVLNARTGRPERVQQVLLAHADHRERLREAGPGAIVVLAGLRGVATGDTLHARGAPIALQPIEFPEPVIRQSVEPRSVADRDRLLAALAALDREDPTLRVEVDEDSGQAVLAGLGELHLEVALHRLARDFRIQARAGRPLVAYRESIREPAEAEGQAQRPLAEGGRQVVTARVRVEPASGARPELVADGLPAGLDRAVREAFLKEAPSVLDRGGELGFPLARLRARLLDLSWHPPGSPPGADLLLGAVSRAVDRALEGRGVVLEPVMALRVEVPDAFLSGVLADLQARQAEIQDLEIAGELRRIRARVPLEGMFAYSTDLRSLTQGRGSFSLEPEGYEPVPPERARALGLAV